MTAYVETQREILATRPRSDRHRELIRRSDALLETIEGLNLRAYGAIRFDRRPWPRMGDLEAVRLTHDLVAAVNSLLLEVGLEVRRMTTTGEALDAVYDAQNVLFHGHPNDIEEETTA